MNKKVLVVDDNYLNIRLLTNILEDENFKVFSTDNGLSVLEIASRVKPDIILLDIMMPGLDGFEVCKLLKDDSEVKDIPVIMVTAKTDGIDIKKSLELGAFDYVKKPIDEIEIVARIRSALRLKQQHDKLRELAVKDYLTGLYNHALLIELLDKELAKQQRLNGSISFAMIDIDYFKEINDTYGHVVGNIVLKEVSNILINSVRRGDIVARYGGEEFGIVIPEVDKEGAFQLCERIRRNMEEYDFDIGSEIIKLTVSIGVFFKDKEEIITGSEIIEKADEELYNAKRNGRNRVEINIL